MAKATTDVPSPSSPPEVDSEGQDGEAESRRPGEAGVEEPPSGELPLDQVFEILRNQRRRYVLHFLSEVDGQIAMGELSEKIAALENGKDVHEITSSERKRVYVGLYQCHLPKMDGMDVISFNKPRGIVEAGPNADIFEEYLHDEENEGFGWHRYYAGMSIVGGVLLLSAFALRPMTTFPLVDLSVAAVIATFFAVSAVNVWRREVDEGVEDDDRRDPDSSPPSE